MKTTDITNYSDQELSLLFNNDESLYKEYQRAIRRNDWQMVVGLCDAYYDYTPDQLANLHNDFDNEVSDYNAE